MNPAQQQDDEDEGLTPPPLPDTPLPPEEEEDQVVLSSPRPEDSHSVETPSNGQVKAKKNIHFFTCPHACTEECTSNANCARRHMHHQYLGRIL